MMAGTGCARPSPALSSFEPSPAVATNRDIIRNARRQLDLGDVRGALEAVTRHPSGNRWRRIQACWQTHAEKRAAAGRRACADLNARLLETAGVASGSAG
jgi:hypothetical protein